MEKINGRNIIAVTASIVDGFTALELKCVGFVV